MEVLGVFAAIIGVIYIVGSVYFGRRYYARRHGVRLSHFGGDDLSIGLIVAAFIGVIWPVAIFVPSLRYPQLCTCPEHVFRRQEARREAERYHEALREEQG